MARLKQVLAMVIHKLSYRYNNDLHFISVKDVNKTFDQTINQVTKTDGQN
ncbi:MAG: hypothetical protein AB8V03_01170 [Francisella endosymbiont of Hyalomma asiaticum]